MQVDKTTLPSDIIDINPYVITLLPNSQLVVPYRIFIILYCWRYDRGHYDIVQIYL